MLPTDTSECPSEAVSTGMKVRRVCSTNALLKAIAQIVTTGFHTSPTLSRREPIKSLWVRLSPSEAGIRTKRSTKTDRPNRVRYGRRCSPQRVMYPANTMRPHCKPGSPPEAENRHAQPGASACVGRNHPGRSGVIDGRADGTHTDQQQDNPEIGSDSHKGDTDRSHERSDQKDQPGSVAVGQIAEYGLDQKGHEGGDPGNHTHLGQVQAEFIRQHRQHRPNKRLEKITDKMN